MANRTTTILAVVVVIVIIIVAAAAVLVTNDSDEESGGESAIASQLQIRGNANDDYTIDDQDMEILDSILAGESSLDDYPLADVNNDGVVDETDKNLLQDLIDRKEGTTVYVLCLDLDGNTTTVQCTYPLRNVVTLATNIQLPVLFANGGQYMAGYFYSSYDVAESSISSNAVQLGSGRTISDANWTAFTELDASLEDGVGALLVDYSSVAQITDARMDDLNAAGIPLIMYPSANSTDEITTVLTLGFLFGGECEELGVEYATISWEVLDAIEEGLADLSDDERVTYICCTMYVYICENDSTYNTSPQDAGGIPYYTVNSEFAETYEGDSSTKMSSVEALSNYRDVGVIINNRSMDWGLTEDEMVDTILECWDHAISGSEYVTKDYFTGLEDKMYFVNNILPGGAKLAYMAYVMYPEIFTLDWANEILQEFIDCGTEPLAGQTIDSIPTVVDYEMYLEVSS